MRLHNATQRRPAATVRPGDVILAINQRPLTPPGGRRPLNTALEHQAGREVFVTVLDREMAGPPPKGAPADPPHTTTRAIPRVPAAHLQGVARFRDLSGMRVGVFRAHANDTTREVRTQVDAALAALEAYGATLVDVAIPHMMALSTAHGMLISSEFAAAHDREYSEHSVPIEASTRIQLALGRSMTAAEFVAANKLRSWGMAVVSSLFDSESLDAIAGPTAGLTAPPLTPAAERTGESNTVLVMSLIKHIFLGNLLGLPAISVPVGLGSDSALPVGFHLLGAAWSEAKLLRLACAVEDASVAAGAAAPRPPTFHPQLDALLSPA